jgi:hypothetical protein
MGYPVHTITYSVVRINSPLLTTTLYFSIRTTLNILCRFKRYNKKKIFSPFQDIISDFDCKMYNNFPLRRANFITLSQRETCSCLTVHLWKTCRLMDIDIHSHYIPTDVILNEHSCENHKYRKYPSLIANASVAQTGFHETLDFHKTSLRVPTEIVE